ncbi:Serine/threonine-protein kinase MPS1 [Cyberlindnera fabianii]|uniref:Serine/threonine-protein kinase MPS1 n=1 Tax=Cyberlindnera fabianii TaxID=36022 RepID=A0A1V2L6D2_CYBFA|nr:Serine/threonine-protein kinase MPS1 [Cyberlindnera fabianii]
MIAPHTDQQSSKSQPLPTQQPTFLSQPDSDDDENSFKPPALSNYALELLRREKDATRIIKEDLTAQRQTSKRVNFRSSPENRGSTKLHHADHPTMNTLNSGYETIFTKSGDYDSYGTTSTALQEKSQKTPLNRSSGSEVGSSNGSNTRLRASNRRTRGFSGLGPPKRTSLSLERTETVDNDNSIQDLPMVDTSNSPSTNLPQPESHLGYRTPVKTIELDHESNGANPNRKPIDFEGLNPYQYSRKHGIPSTELPNLVKLYFEQQKSATKEALNYSSPVRLKEAIQNQIVEQLHPEKKYIPEAQRELFKTEKTTQQEAPPIQVFTHDKENTREPLKKVTSSIERAKSSRRPLAPIIDSRQHLQPPSLDPPKTLSHQQELRQGEYKVRHYQQTEPLKAPGESRKSSRLLTINGKQYEKLELLGKGGSSKVFKAKSLNNKVYAIKKIVFDEFDDSSISGFKGEIDLLLKLRDQDRVVRLVDYALGQGSLSLVMECGDIDLSHVLAKRLDIPMDVEFVRFHANEVLKCVKAVHDAGIVHSDLKPANFLFVKGMVKIIDFGIANAVPDHTVNIYRESQIGTPNYMAPEALIDNNQQLADSSHHKSQWKVGKPSDIWSCGCIIYQMIYGRPPYGGYQGSQRLLAIMNPDVKIAYPDKGLGGVKVPGTAIETIQACLRRDPGERWTASEILEGPFLRPRVVSEQFVNDLVKNAITYGVGKSSVDSEEIRSLADDVWKRVSQLSL